MTIGRVEHIHLAGRAAEPMRAVSRIRAIEGVGLEGDRYALGLGYYSGKPPGTGRHLTLIEGEMIDWLRETHGIELKPGESRRNLTTRGISLNPLVGKRFRIGSVACVGVRYCDPCQYLDDLTGKKMLKPMVDRAGLRADILEGGEIAVGDEIRPD